MSHLLDDVRRFALGRVVAMPKTYVRLVKDARYRWLAFVKFCECGFESGARQC